MFRAKLFIFQTNVYSRICCLSVNVHTYQLYILTQHSELFKYWSAITRIYTEGKSLILNLGLGLNFTINYLPSVLILIIADHILNDLLCCFDKYNLCLHRLLVQEWHIFPLAREWRVYFLLNECHIFLLKQCHVFVQNVWHVFSTKWLRLTKEDIVSIKSRSYFSA